MCMCVCVHIVSCWPYFIGRVSYSKDREKIIKGLRLEEKNPGKTMDITVAVYSIIPGNVHIHCIYQTANLLDLLNLKGGEHGDFPAP